MRKRQSSLMARGIAVVRAIESSRPEGERVLYDPYARHFVSGALYAFVRFFVRIGYGELRGPGVIASEATNAAGQARLRFLMPGSYELKIIHAEYATLVEPIEVQGRSGEIVRWFTLREG